MRVSPAIALTKQHALSKDYPMAAASRRIYCSPPQCSWHPHLGRRPFPSGKQRTYPGLEGSLHSLVPLRSPSHRSLAWASHKGVIRALTTGGSVSSRHQPWKWRYGRIGARGIVMVKGRVIVVVCSY